MLEAGVRWTPNDSFSLRGGYEWFDFAGGGDGGLRHRGTNRAEH